jgi:hypothetical protein
MEASRRERAHAVYKFVGPRRRSAAAMTLSAPSRAERAAFIALLKN